MSVESRPVISASRILLLVACVIFILAAFGVGFGGVQLVPLGLAFLVAGMIV